MAYLSVAVDEDLDASGAFPFQDGEMVKRLHQVIPGGCHRVFVRRGSRDAARVILDAGCLQGQCLHAFSSSASMVAQLRHKWLCPGRSLLTHSTVVSQRGST